MRRTSVLVEYDDGVKCGVMYKVSQTFLKDVKI